MPSIYNWSTTAASNASADSDINWAEGQGPSTVNNSARQVMGRVAEWLGDIGGALTAGGTANAITVTANSAFTSYADGQRLTLRIASDNTSAATLNVNAIGAKSIRKMLATGESALTGAELQADGVYELVYSTALNTAAGGWLLLNPTGVDPATLVTLTGSQTLTNKTLTSPTINGGTWTGGTDLAVADGGTGASTAANARTNLGLGTIATQAASSVAITGGTASGVTITGSAFNGTVGATTPSSVNATSYALSGAALPFTKSFESAQQTITAGGSLTIAHGLGSQPKLYLAVLQCVTGEGGYSTGEEVLPAQSSNEAGSNRGLSLVPDATNINIRQGAGGMQITRKDNGAFLNITNSSWKMVIRAWA